MNQPIHNKHGERIDYSYHEGSQNNALVLIGHGVTGNKDRDMVVNLANHLAAAGFPCLRFSYSGNGNSDGSFTECTISKEVDDLTAVIDQLGTGKKIAYCGHSMGAAVGAMAAARDERINVLVSMAGMVRTDVFYNAEFGEEIPDSGNMWGKEECVVSSVFRDDMLQIGNTLNAIKEVRAPWLFVHGTEDDTVLFKDSEDAFAVAKRPKSLTPIEGANHMFEEDPGALHSAVLEWLQEHL